MPVTLPPEAKKRHEKTTKMGQAAFLDDEDLGCLYCDTIVFAGSTLS